LLIIIALIATTLICVVLRYRTVVEFFSAVASCVVLLGSSVVAFKVSNSGVYAPFTFFSVDSLGAILLLVTGFIYCLTTIYSIQYLHQESAKKIVGLTRVRQYFALLNLFVMAMILAITANSPVLAWIAIEATTLSTAFLISFYNKPSAMEAAWKYLIINSIGLLLGFFGTLLYFTAISQLGLLGFASWQTLIDNAIHLDPLIAKIAFIFVLIGYGTKVGLAPMHTWLPDAHSKAPAPISALLSGVLLNVAFIIVLRFKVITDLVVGQHFSQIILIVFGVLSILIAALIIFTQKNYKRLLAYSSIENMGIITLGFGLGGLGVLGATLHIIYHALIKSALFLSAGTIFLKYSSTKIAKINSAITALPVTSVLFLIGVLAITGAPPFGIFLSKILVVTASIKIYPFVSWLVLGLIAILFVGFFRHTTAMVFGDKPDGIKLGEINTWLVIPPMTLILVALYLSFSPPQFLLILINNVVLNFK